MTTPTDLTGLLGRLGLPGDALDSMTPAGSSLVAQAAGVLDQLTDADVEAFGQLLAAEQMRRAQLASIPGQIAALTQTYTRAGGDPADLTG